VSIFESKKHPAKSDEDFEAKAKGIGCNKMNTDIQRLVKELGSKDDKIRMDALEVMLRITESKADWVYEVWDHLLEKLDNTNSYQRSIGIKLLCNLAKSDSEDRLHSVLDRLLAHTKDEKFITSRHCLQSIWKAATTTKSNRAKVLSHLEKRFAECLNEKHYNLLRQDIIQSMVLLYKYEGDDELLATVRGLIAKEQNIKYRKQYEMLLEAK
jgi:hypothetical protein